MYGGLFGDLPAAKNAKDDGETATAEAAGGNNDNGKKQNQDSSSKPRTVQEPKSSKPSSSSVVKNLGVAGTSLAFLPTAALQRKRKASQTSSSKPVAKPTTTQPAEPIVLKTQNLDLATSWTEASKTTTTTTTTTTKTAMIHTSNNEDTFSEHQHHADTNEPQQQQQQQTETEELQHLHENVTDPYDPMVPNDLLQYWERKAAMLERQELEREAKETMETQKRIREQLEAERLELEKSGQVDKIIEHRQKYAAGAGRGRGRGISNLPAWYVEQQKQAAEGRLQPPTNDNT